MGLRQSSGCPGHYDCHCAMEEGDHSGFRQREAMLRVDWPTTEPLGEVAIHIGKPQAKNSSGSGANWYLGEASESSSLVVITVNSRTMFDGTVTATDMDRATDAREKGRIGIFGTGNAYAGSSGRVTSERIGRDLNPLGRGSGYAYVGGAQNYGKIAPRLPGNSSPGGWGNSVNNSLIGGDGEIEPPVDEFCVWCCETYYQEHGRWEGTLPLLCLNCDCEALGLGGGITPIENIEDEVGDECNHPDDPSPPWEPQRLSIFVEGDTSCSSCWSKFDTCVFEHEEMGVSATTKFLCDVIGWGHFSPSDPYSECMRSLGKGSPGGSCNCRGKKCNESVHAKLRGTLGISAFKEGFKALLKGSGPYIDFLDYLRNLKEWLDDPTLINLLLKMLEDLLTKLLQTVSKWMLLLLGFLIDAWAFGLYCCARYADACRQITNGKSCLIQQGSEHGGMTASWYNSGECEYNETP